MPYDKQTVEKIFSHADALGIPRALQVAVAWQESKLNPYEKGDEQPPGSGNFTSWGLYQAHIPAHGHDSEYWVGLDGADHTFEVMRRRWLDTWQAMDQSLWRTDPATFFYRYHPRAQGAEQITASAAAQAISAAQQIVSEYSTPVPDPDARVADLYRDPQSGWRLPAAGPITQGFGMTEYAKNHPEIYGPQGHTGIDIGAAHGSPVRSVRPGTVIYAGWRNVQGIARNDNTGFGLCVYVEESDGTRHVYAHLSDIEVVVGDQVVRGQLVGRVGQTGRAFGAHVHYQVERGGGALNPEPWLAELKSAGRAVITAVDGLRLRAEPHDNAPVLALVPNGTTVSLRHDGWYPVHWNGHNGYSWGEYLAIEQRGDQSLYREELHGIIDAAHDDGIFIDEIVESLYKLQQRLAVHQLTARTKLSVSGES